MLKKLLRSYLNQNKEIIMIKRKAGVKQCFECEFCKSKMFKVYVGEKEFSIECPCKKSYLTINIEKAYYTKHPVFHN